MQCPQEVHRGGPTENGLTESEGLKSGTNRGFGIRSGSGITTALVANQRGIVTISGPVGFREGI